MGCIAPQALLSWLVFRIERDGYMPSREDVETLIRAGCSVDEIRAAMERGAERRDAPGFGHTRELLDTLSRHP